IVYDGGEAGRFSYAYSGNFGDASNRLMYVPNNASELQFQEFSLGGERITAARQAELLNAYIDQDDYLSSRRGQVAERNGAKRPWVHSFDLRLTQDINITKDAKNRLQLSLDFLNVGNLLNSAWGIPQFEFQDNLLNYRGVDAATQQPIYRLNTIPGTSDFPTETFRNSTSLGNTWRLQVGARYIFN
ncbi:MAG: cell envelope biogenesis protein OmpA, partial [Spirosomataceae bacterium]